MRRPRSSGAQPERRLGHLAGARAELAVQRHDLARRGRSRFTSRKPPPTATRVAERERAARAELPRAGSGRSRRRRRRGRPWPRRASRRPSSAVWPCEHDVAVAQDLTTRSAISLHLVEPVRDVDERDALLAQAPHEGEQPLDLLVPRAPPWARRGSGSAPRPTARARSRRSAARRCAASTTGASRSSVTSSCSSTRRARRRTCAPARRCRARFGSRPREMFSATRQRAARRCSSWKIMRMPAARARDRA